MSVLLAYFTRNVAASNAHRNLRDITLKSPRGLIEVERHAMQLLREGRHIRDNIYIQYL